MGEKESLAEFKKRISKNTFMKYPVSQPDLSQKEISYAKDALDSGWISSKGPYIEKFEKAWASYNEMAYGVTCNSGTNALYLALMALRIGPGDEVIVPDFTMIATAWAVTYCGATPVFVDCKDDLTIDEAQIEAKISEKTKAIMPVHIYGRQCNMKEINRIAHEYNLYVVEDIAEGHGIKPEGDIACYSFYGNKIITTGEGGMSLTNNKKWADQMNHYKSMAFNAEHTFLHKKLGFNFRMTNVQAAIGLGQVERINEILGKRKQIGEWYDKYLDKKVQMPQRQVVWMYDIRVSDQEGMYEYLKTQEIESRVFFKPMTQQPMYKEGASTKADFYAKCGLYLPTYTQLTEEDVKLISEKVNSYDKS